MRILTKTVNAVHLNAALICIIAITAFSDNTCTGTKIVGINKVAIEAWITVI